MPRIVHQICKTCGKEYVGQGLLFCSCGGYEKGNIALCCYRCNFVKNTIFNFDEMRDIAQKYIKPKWVNKISTYIK